MLIQKIFIDGIRNLQSSCLHFDPEINVFIGSNGSGKTSLLESIYFLTLGRSFRTIKSNNLIKLNNDFAAVSAVLSDRKLNKYIKIKSVKHKGQNKFSNIGGALAANWEVALLAPSQVINDETSKLIFKEPDLRRKFLDWLVFYSNSKYQGLWREFNKTLQQRNYLLKKREPKLITILNQLDNMFVSLSEKITKARQDVWLQFEPVWNLVFNELYLDPKIHPEITFFQGWNGELFSQLERNLPYDLKGGSTSCGPHKADLRLVVQGGAAKDILSRGQGKVLSLALVLARARFIRTIADREDFISLLLIDDLCAELDNVNVEKVFKGLFQLSQDLQIFITGTDKEKLANVLEGKSCAWFEMSDGVVEPVEAKGLVHFIK